MRHLNWILFASALSVSGASFATWTTVIEPNNATAVSAIEHYPIATPFPYHGTKGQLVVQCSHNYTTEIYLRIFAIEDYDYVYGVHIGNGEESSEIKFYRDGVKTIQNIGIDPYVGWKLNQFSNLDSNGALVVPEGQRKEWLRLLSVSDSVTFPTSVEMPLNLPSLERSVVNVNWEFDLEEAGRAISKIQDACKFDNYMPRNGFG